MQILAPISIGELADKLIILSIKLERMPHSPARYNVFKEWRLLTDLWLGNDGPPYSVELAEKVQALRIVNGQLWNVEDALRLCERDKNFGLQFISLARTVYSLNDKRGALKRKINLMTGSEIVEEKLYAS